MNSSDNSGESTPLAVTPGSASWPADGNLVQVAQHMQQCGEAWEPGARLIGNCRACDIAAIAEEYLLLREDIAAEIPLPTIPDALRFRSDQMGWNDSMMADKLGMGRSHYSEVLSGKRPLPLSAIRHSYALGVPASVLLQPNDSR